MARIITILKCHIFICFSCGILISLSPLQVNAIELTEAELAWLATHTDVKIATTKDYEPISFLNGQGEHQGIAADYLKIIEKKLKRINTHFHFISVAPNATQSAANDPKVKGVDVVPAFVQTPERLKYWFFSKPYISLPLCLIVKNDISESYTLDKAHNETIAVVGYYAAKEFLSHDYPNLRLLSVNNTQEGLQKVAFGEAKAFITDLPSASWWAEKAGLVTLRSTLQTRYQYQIGIAVRSDWPEFNRIIQKVMTEISPAEHDAIQARWFIGPFTKKPLYQDWRFWGIFSTLLLLSIVIIGLLGAIMRNQRRLSKQNNTLIMLSDHRLGAMPTLKRFDDICSHAAQTLSIARVSIWLFEDHKTVLRCVSLYDHSKGLIKTDAILTLKSYPTYFEALRKSRVIAAHDAATDSATRELANDYLPRNHVTSLLNATLFKHDDLIGVICHEHIGKPRTWRLDEQNFARSVADILCLVLEVEERRGIQKELIGYQMHLEDMVKIRTESLEKSEHRFRTVVQGAPLAIICFTKNGIITEFNPQAEKTTGYKAKKALGKSFSDFLLTSEDRAKANQVIKELDFNNAISDVVLNINHADGRIVECSWHLNVENDSQNELMIVAVADNISQRKQLEHYLKTAKDSAVAADLLKSMFVASMSHELRTPLNSIIGFIGVVMQGMSGEINTIQKDHLNRAYQSAKHLLALISDVIDISKIEAQYIAVEVNTFSLSGVIDSAINNVQHLNLHKDLSIIVDCDPHLMIETDRKRFLQVILNVLSNAVKYTERGTVKIKAVELANSIVVTIVDTGIGIDAMGMKKLFLPFERLDSDLRIKVAGTGLGLYLTRKIITEILGGTINVTSKPNYGSKFIMTFPKVLATDASSLIIENK